MNEISDVFGNSSSGQLQTQTFHVYRILDRKCGRTVFTHELLMYQKSND